MRWGWVSCNICETSEACAGRLENYCIIYERSEQNPAEELRAACGARSAHALLDPRASSLVSVHVRRSAHWCSCTYIYSAATCSCAHTFAVAIVSASVRWTHTRCCARHCSSVRMRLRILLLVVFNANISAPLVYTVQVVDSHCSHLNSLEITDNSLKKY